MQFNLFKKTIYVLMPLLVFFINSYAQQIKLIGKVTNAQLEPLSFVTVQIKDVQIGTKTDDDGRFEFMLEEGQYEIVFSLIGYKKQSIKLLHRKTEGLQNVILEESSSQMEELKIVGFRKDKAEEIIRNVIEKKQNIMRAASSFSAEVYIRATEENETGLTKRKREKLTDSARAVLDAKLPDMSMTEVYLQLNYQYPDKVKEIRTGVKKRGNNDGLFFLSTTEGDFNLYNNLIRIPALSETPMLSPISFSGLMAYRYKTKNIFKRNNYTIYTIQFIPGRLGNALLEGEVQIVDTSWTIISSTFRFPKYHLNEYDYFEANQTLELVDEKAWLPTRQEFIYISKGGKSKTSGRTIAVYDHYKIDTQFAKRYFNREISSTSIEAYKQDSNFWNTVRKEPLNENEVKFIFKNDSTYRATHSKEYLDSIDHRTNKITALKILFFGQENYKREKERTISINPVVSMVRPFLPGGTRIATGGSYRKIFPSKKSLYVNGELSYGLRNRDFMGSLMLQHIYNPFSQGYFVIDAGRSFDLIFYGDAFINLFRRSNFYIKNNISFEHGLEVANGLVFRAKAEFARRESIDQLKLNKEYDSLLVFNNDPVKFNSYNSLYGSLTLEYTPFQNYIREPRQKIILGSKFPTFYAKWRKGIAGVLQSEVNFDYLEFGIFQKLKLGLAGISQYRIQSGEFITQKDLKYIDYKFISRGNPFLFNNPLISFQNLDSTFPVFNRFYEAHYLHHFNGSIINKIPLIKKLKLLEVIGGGFLFLPERNLNYTEAYVGIEKIIPLFRERFKIGFYVSGSLANKYNNPFQLKFGLDKFDRRTNSWD
ncbi:MAG: carboxypeptidase-like regulatory domain-containing protein [Bacteroidetes bacterium]|nr:carboxypeptidase-like regulatory domain-containing protein [Bacteroidota bacterium]